MSVLKMEAVTIAGKISDFDTLVSKYVVGKEIHLENAVSVLENGEKLVPFEEDSKYDSLLKMAKDILASADISPEIKNSDISMSYEEMFDLLDGLNNQIESISREKRQKQSHSVNLNMTRR